MLLRVARLLSHPATIAAAGAFALFAATVCPTVPFGDGGELIAVSQSFGVAHPPGYPLYTLLLRVALLVPFGEPALRTNLLSAVFGALACAAAAGWLSRVTECRLAAVAGGLALAASSTFWSVATVTEVYSLHVLLVLSLLGFAHGAGTGSTRRSRSLALFAAACALGAGLAHHPTIVLAVPAALVLAASRPADCPGPRWVPDVSPAAVVAAAATALAIPVALYLSLSFRASLDPATTWARPVDLGALWTHATAAAYRHLDLGWAGLARPAAWRELGSRIATDLTPLALPLAGLGLVGLPGASPVGTWRARVAVASIAALGAVFGLRYTTSDDAVFDLPVLVAIALAAGLGVGELRRRAERPWRVAGAVAGLVLVAVPIAVHGPSRSLRGFTAAVDFSRDVLDTVPRDGVLFVDSDDAFPLLYLTRVLEERPDVRVYHRDGLLFRDVVQERPIEPLDGESWAAFRLRAEQAFLDSELGRPRPTGVYFFGWPGYEMPPRYRLEPVGLLHRVVHAGAPLADDGPLWSRYREERVRAQAERTQDGFGLTVAASYPLARGERALFLGDAAGAHARFEEAAQIATWQETVQNYVGTVYARIGDYTRACAYFRRAVEAQPTSLRAWNNLARAALLAGDRRTALRAWTRSLELAPGQPEVREALRDLRLSAGKDLSFSAPPRAAPRRG